MLRWALSSAVAVRSAGNMVGVKGGSFDDVQRNLMHSALLVLDEISKTPVRPALLNEMTAAHFEPNIKYQERQEGPRRGNTLLIGDGRGVNIDMDVQGVKERLAYRLHYERGLLAPLTRDTRENWLHTPEAADMTLSLIADSILQRRNSPPEWSARKAREMADDADVWYHELGDVIEDDAEGFVTTQMLLEVCAKIATRLGLPKPDAALLSGKIQRLHPNAVYGRSRKSGGGNPQRGYFGIRLTTTGESLLQ